MSINIITAMTKDFVIGDKKCLPWRIPEELENFKKITSGSIVIMGRSTWESIPENNKPLKNRFNIIVSSSLKEQKGIIVCSTLNEAISFAKETARNTNQEIFFIGGSKIYEEALDYADNLYVSWIKNNKGNYTGDVFFPKIDFSNWRKKSENFFKEFTFIMYEKKVC
jgi:dihydrofolate reductase